MSSNLPKGWTMAKLGDIADINPRHPSGLDNSLRVTFIPMPAVSEKSWHFQYTEERILGEVRQGYTHFAEGDVLLAKITPCMENGKAAIAVNLKNKLGCGSTEFHVLRMRKGIDNTYVYHFLHQDSFRRIAAQNFTGTAGQERVPVSFIRDSEIPLPPVKEQRRISLHLEMLLEKVYSCRKRADQIPVIIRRFRQAILNAAVTGSLTANWRMKNRIQSTAANEIEALRGVATNLKAREAESTEGHELLTENIPDSWEAPSLGNIFKFIDYRGKTPKKAKSGRRLITAKNIRMGFVAENPIEFVSMEFYRAWMTRGFPKKGDIFFVTEGHTMGFAAVNNRNDEFALAQRTITLQPWQPIETQCFLYFIMSTPFQNLVRLNATGSAAVGIKAARLRNLPIPYPSKVEQKEIVRIVGELFALADKIEARYLTVRSYINDIERSALAMAFRGELVPQDPNDEPADVLLTRIKESKQLSPSTSRRNKTSKDKSVRSVRKKRRSSISVAVQA